tara:strand:- start:255 stop:668 length:414 start_codon:yes stop_codon:yes gene_type:complete
MTNKQIEKSLNRLNEIEKIIMESNFTQNNYIDRSNLFLERSEIHFKLNKQNINFILKGSDKYYYANQCKEFSNNLLKYGYGNISKKDIKKNGVSFNKYSINNGYNQYCNDIKRFSSTDELLGFVIGYNEAISNLKRK